MAFLDASIEGPENCRVEHNKPQELDEGRKRVQRIWVAKHLSPERKRYIFDDCPRKPQLYDIDDSLTTRFLR